LVDCVILRFTDLLISFAVETPSQNRQIPKSAIKINIAIAKQKLFNLKICLQPPKY